ncbi:MAG: hypothetical protein ACRELY_28055 [Polyangiaceae bacterium]
MRSFVRFATLSILGATVALAACSSSNPGTPGDAGVGSEGGPGPVLGVPTLHLPSGSTCRATRGPGNTSSFTCPDAGDPSCCAADTDCTDGNNGRCTVTGNGGPRCTYDECATSSDCSAGKSCGCGDINPYSYNICVASNCRTDSDCGAGGYCSPSLDFTCGTYGGEYAGIYCHTAQDQCANDSDCSSGTQAASGRCSYNPESSRWECATGFCAG